MQGPHPRGSCRGRLVNGIVAQWWHCLWGMLAGHQMVSLYGERGLPGGGYWRGTIRRECTCGRGFWTKPGFESVLLKVSWSKPGELKPSKKPAVRYWNCVICLGPCLKTPAIHSETHADWCADQSFETKEEA